MEFTLQSNTENLSQSVRDMVLALVQQGREKQESFPNGSSYSTWELKNWVTLNSEDGLTKGEVTGSYGFYVTEGGMTYAFSVTKLHGGPGTNLGKYFCSKDVTEVQIALSGHPFAARS